MTWWQIANMVLPVVAIVVAILALVVAQRRSRQSWIGGYWTGKRDVHQSLQRMLSKNQEKLEHEPEQLALMLIEWLHDERISDEALAKVQKVTA